MPIKQTITEEDFPKILANYNLGAYEGYKTFANGAGQTTILLETTTGKFVLRYYENRSQDHVDFEVRLFEFLEGKEYPVPKVIATSSGQPSGVYKNKPYIVLEFVEGEHGKNPNEEFDRAQATEVVRAVAELHLATNGKSPDFFHEREGYSVDYCWDEYQKRPNQDPETTTWLRKQLDDLHFPESLPKGICHADVNYGNFLFKGGKIVAVLDFDMSFYTYFVYDIASLLYWWTWSPAKGFDLEKGRFIVDEYSRHRDLDAEEKTCVYDALKLIILLGIAWSDESEFEENRKTVESLNKLGRDEFYKALA